MPKSKNDQLKTLVTTAVKPGEMLEPGIYEVPGVILKKQADALVKKGAAEWYRPEPEPEEEPEAPPPDDPEAQT